MTSELRVDNLKGSTTGGSINVLGEGTSATTNLQQGLAKCWVNFNGTGTIATRDSNNVSSLTDSGTGVCDTNFSNNFGNANYAYNVTCANTSSPYVMTFWITDVASATTSKVRSETLYVSNTSGAGANADSVLVSVAVHGDLA